VERLVDLPLICGAITEISDADKPVATIAVGEGEAAADRNLSRNNPVAAEEILLAAKHVHRAALALGITAAAPRQFGHHTARIHPAGEHVPMVTIPGDDGVTVFQRRLD